MQDKTTKGSFRCDLYTRVFALDAAATLAVSFTGDGHDAAEILRALPPMK